MADNRMNRGPTERSIDICDPSEVRFWCRELEITPLELRYVVNAVGPMVDDVKQELARMPMA
jgi:hypothetical protein